MATYYNLEDIERDIEYHPDTLFNKNEVIPNNCYVNITVENVARPDGWSTTNITHTRPQLDNIPQGILSGMMTNDQSNVVSNALNNAINRVSDRQQFRHNHQSNQRPSISADNSPIQQPQAQLNENIPQIIPIISVSQNPLNIKKPVCPDEFVDEM